MQSHTIPLFRPYEERDLPAVLEVYRQCEDFLALGPVARASLQMVQQDLAISRQENGSRWFIALWKVGSRSP